MLTFMLNSDSALKLVHLMQSVQHKELFFLEKTYLPYLHKTKLSPNHLLKVWSIQADKWQSMPFCVQDVYAFT